MKHTMLRTLLLSGVAALLLGTLTAATQGAPTTRYDLTIRHAKVGCHLWSLNGNDFAATQQLVMREGQSFTVENRDNCGHELVQAAGPTAAAVENLSGNEEATIEPLRPGVRVTLLEPGLYRFKTVENEALKYGWRTELYGGFSRLPSNGHDRTLQLVVRVWPDHNHLH